MSNNYAFIDSQNLNMATHTLGWNMDWAKFRAYLKTDFEVEVAYLFIGYMPEHQEMYSALQKSGYVVVFKPVTVNREGEVKGNIDAELVLQAMIDFERYDQAVIVTGDGDFASLISHLTNKNKLRTVMIPNQRQFSPLLKAAAKDNVTYLNNLRRDLEYRRYSNNRTSQKTEDRDQRTDDRSQKPEDRGQKPETSPAVTNPASRASSQEPAPKSPEPTQSPKPPVPTPPISVATPTPATSLSPGQVSSPGRGSSIRNLEDAIIKATSTPQADTRKPNPPRRRPKPQTPTS